MFTDKPPQGKDRLGFLESDRINTLGLPQDVRLLPEIAKNIEAAMQTGKIIAVRVACDEFLATAADFYKVPKCGVRVLAARPLKGREWTYELFGDYDPATMLMQLWMRTARKKEVTSFGTFLSTLCHEFCHHLDYHLFKFRDSWHTRGFYDRTALHRNIGDGTEELLVIKTELHRLDKLRESIHVELLGVSSVGTSIRSPWSGTQRRYGCGRDATSVDRFGRQAVANVLRTVPQLM